MKAPLDLLRDEMDTEIPHEHDVRIRAGLASVLQAPAPKGPGAHEVNEAAKAPVNKVVSALSPKHIVLLIGTHLSVGALAYTLGSAQVKTTPKVQTQPPNSAPSALLPTVQASETTAALEPTHMQEIPSAQPVASAIASSTPSMLSTPSTPPTLATQSAFDREQSLLERARGALVRHDGQAAALALDEYERSFPRGHNREEADYLGIQWARQQGKRDIVQTRGQDFIKHYPKSLFRQRVQNMLEQE